MKKFLAFLLLTMPMIALAQRYTDRLDRGLVAMKANGGVFLSWRITAEEYYDVTYNVYRDGEKLNDVPLSVSNYQDTSGATDNQYTVRAIINGAEQADCNPATPWSTSYKEITLKHEGIKSSLVPNDATCADVDGDGELEILMKFDNQSEIEQSYPKNGPEIDGVDTKEYSIFECLKQDGTRLWWVNCGPNMGDFQNNEQNIIAYDWDEDGRAEVVMRAADGTVIHLSDSTTYTVGDPTKNVRAATGGGTNWFVTTDGEYLLYMDGLTGQPYQCIPYPLKRLESNETDLNRAWGDGYGHRTSKHFFGAPYFDGQHPSLFLARGIYTRHKMIAYDINPATHELTERWRWTCNTDGPWKGQGYHNYCMADVDWDGRDEIVFGSMVIDDNGKGLSTTGFGHGDAEHVGDLDPYRHGHEIFACMEDNPGTNYRDATTSKVFYRYTAARDVGRCMAGNFSNSFPGSLCTPTDIGPISTVTAGAISGLGDTGVNQNFRIYWDGDLCEESFNYLDGKNTAGCIAKYGSWNPIYTCVGSLTNNDTKGTPCFQGDILGDWREEIIMRTADGNIRIYSTPSATEWRNYTLWHDHQYRNAMVWQMCGYNQPPRPSYFLGELEGITIAPPPLTTSGRVSIADNSAIDASQDGQHVLVSGYADMNVSIADNPQPAVLTFNVPSWVQGTAPSECASQNTAINYTYYICNVTGSGISGNGRLVKQGDGTLVLPKADFTHTGETNIWGGTLCFDGRLTASPLWLNRFTRLESNGGQFCSIAATYGSSIVPGGADCSGTVTADSVSLGFGSRLVLDLFGEGLHSDTIRTRALLIEHKTGTAWTKGGPVYLVPVIELKGHPAEGQTSMPAGKYVIAELEALHGSVDDIIVEGLETVKKRLYVEDGQLVLEIVGLRDAATVTWTGTNGSAWDEAETDNFVLNGESTPFVAGDHVVFNDEAQSKTVSINDNVYPASVTVDNTATYTFKGSGSIGGNAVFTKQNTGGVTMNVENAYTGGNHLCGGTVRVNTLSNQYSTTGNLGGLTDNADLFTMEGGATLQTQKAVEMGSPMKMVGDEGGVLNAVADFKMNAALSGTKLTKKGNGCLYLMKAGSLDSLIMTGGDVAIQNNTAVRAIEIQSGTLWDDVQATSHAIRVPKGRSATWQLTWEFYTAYANKLTGKGTLTIVPRNDKSRVRITGDWSAFEGTIKHTNKNNWLPLDMEGGMPNATLNIADGCTVSNVAKTFAIGKLVGKGMLNEPVHDFRSQNTPKGSNTWEVGNSWEEGGNFTFDGQFTDAGGTNKCIFNKVGTSKMTVGGKSYHSGTTTVKAGELCLKSGAQLGTGKLTVQKGAVLSGFTSAAAPLTNSSVSINNGGTLRVGTGTDTSGRMDFGGNNVTFSTGSILQLGANGPAAESTTGCTCLQNIGTLTMNGNIEIFVPESHTLSAGDSIVVWKNVTTVKGTPVLVNEVIDPERGLCWDSSDLANGILRVLFDPTGIQLVRSSDEDSPAPVFDLNGCRVADEFTDHLQRGIYLYKGKKIVVGSRRK